MKLSSFVLEYQQTLRLNIKFLIFKLTYQNILNDIHSVLLK